MSDAGWTRVPNAVARSTTLSVNARVVYLALASRADDAGRCWPSRRTIAKDSGIALSTVSVALSELRGAGFVEWTQALAEDGTPCGASTYFLRPEGVTATRTGVTARETPPIREADTGVTATRTQKKTHMNKTQRTTSSSMADASFDEFWSAYPRRVGKGQARKAWASAMKKTDASTIIAGAARFASSSASSDLKFVPYPATWLNGERWDDEEAAPKPVAGSSVWDRNVTEQRLSGVPA